MYYVHMNVDTSIRSTKNKMFCFIKKMKRQTIDWEQYLQIHHLDTKRYRVMDSM